MHLLLKKIIVLEQKLKSMEMQLKKVLYSGKFLYGAKFHGFHR